MDSLMLIIMYIYHVLYNVGETNHNNYEDSFYYLPIIDFITQW